MYSRYKKLLDEKGLKTSDVCRATGIDAATMSNWKKGAYTPKDDKIKKIEEFFGVPDGYISRGIDSPEIGPEDANHSSYYLNEETAKKAQEIYDDPNTRILLDARRDLSPEDLDIVVKLVMKLKGED